MQDQKRAFARFFPSFAERFFPQIFDTGAELVVSIHQMKKEHQTHTHNRACTLDVQMLAAFPLAMVSLLANFG